MHFSHLGTFYNNKEVEMAARDGLSSQQPDFYTEGTFQSVPRSNESVNVPGDYA
jgi:hypothetical protein